MNIQNAWFFTETPYSKTQAFLDLYVQSRTEDRNACSVTERALAQRWEWSREQVRHFLKRLEKEGWIKKESERKQTKIRFLSFFEDSFKPNSTHYNSEKQWLNCPSVTQTAPNQTNAYYFFEMNGYGTLSPLVSEQIKQWIENEGFSDGEAIVIEALKIGVEQGVRKWAYANKILFSWAQKGLYTIEAVRAEQAQYKVSNRSKGGTISEKTHRENARRLGF